MSPGEARAPRRTAPAARWLTASLLVLGLASLAFGAVRPRNATGLFEDERVYAGAAAALLRHGVLAFSPPGSAPPAPGAYREPGYPALVAISWWLAGAAPPATAEEIVRLPEQPRRFGAVRALNVLLLAVAAGAAGLGVGRLAGRAWGALAFGLAASSPALQTNLSQVMSENLAAAHVALAALSLLALARRARGARWTVAVVVGLLPLTRAEGILLLPVALLVELLAGRARPRPARIRALATLALLLALPAALWLGRNARATGHAVLSDRGGLALGVRAELDADVGRFGAVPAALAWTPLEAARRAALARAPAAGWLDYRPAGPGNFYTRTFRRWHEERSRPGADPVAVDAGVGRAALARFARHPVDHARAAAAVAWRGLFCETSPRWSHPFDLAFAIGLLLAGGMLAATWRAARGRDAAALALLAPAWVLFGFHVAATELLPRYSTPLLALAWAALALALAPARDRSGA